VRDLRERNGKKRFSILLDTDLVQKIPNMGSVIYDSDTRCRFGHASTSSLRFFAAGQGSPEHKSLIRWDLYIITSKFACVFFKRQIPDLKDSKIQAM
jgi:hypothetical protein